MLDTLFSPTQAVPLVAALADLTIKAALILALAGIATSLLRKRPASVRHAIWLAAVTGILAMPVLTAMLPNWHVLPAGSTFHAAAIEQHNAHYDAVVAQTEAANPWTTDTGDGLAAESEAGVPPTNGSATTRGAANPEASAITPGASAARTEAAGTVESAAPGTEVAGTAAPSTEAPSTAAPSTEAPGAAQLAEEPAAPAIQPARNAVLAGMADIWSTLRSTHWSVILLGIWLLGVLAIMGHHFIGAVGLYMVARRARPIRDQEWLDLADEIGDRLWITREVHLLKSHVTTMPVTWGGRKPVVLLPSDADTWTDERRRYVLTHEFAHIRRWDCTTQGFAQLACALYWFNPLVWVASRRLRVERERACDDQVLMAGGKASNYAEHLLDIARSLRATIANPLGAVAMARPSQLEGRVLAILDPDRRRRGFTRAHTTAVMIAALVVVLPIAALAPQSSATDFATTPTETEAPASWDSADVQAPEAAPESPDPAPESELAERARSFLPAVADRRPNVALPDTIDTRKRKVVDAFMKALGDEDEEIRRQAAHVLGEIGDARAIPALRKAMSDDPSNDVRRAALWALAEMDEDDVIPVLINQVGSERDPESRRQMAYMIGDNADDGDRRAGQALMSLLDDSDAEVRATAAWGLAEIEYTPALDALLALAEDPNDDVQERAIWAIGEIAEEADSGRAVEVLIGALGSQNANVREMAAWSLGESESPRATEALAAALNAERSPEVKAKIAWALGEIEDDRAVPALAVAMRDANTEVRTAAAYALSEIDTSESLRALALAVDDDDVKVRRQAIYALSELEDVESIPVLERAARDGDSQIRKAAIYALAELEDERAIPALVAALDDGNAQIRRQAIYGLGELESDNPRVIEGLQLALGDENAETRRAAIHALGEIEDSGSADALIDALSDGNADNRRAAAWAIAEILEDEPNERALNALAEMLRADGNAENRKAAAYALGEIGSPDAIDALRAALDDENRDVRRAAAHALSDIDWDDDEWDSNWDDGNKEEGDWDNQNWEEGDWDNAGASIDVHVDPGTVHITGLGAAIGDIAETALSAAGSALRSIDFENVLWTIEHELSSVDVDAWVDHVESQIHHLDHEIESSVRFAMIEALEGIAKARPNSADSRAAVRALKRMDTKESHKAVKRIKDCDCH
ncbi:MAG: HEAT repeat domain-containing protein [Rhodothermales bacterium]|nr:HEAT repeat domain-containing protein [Rhodothermales bacterium]MBO6779710.1 HEAT repeat domain-containing protein [Rhodothermales bacterium]